MNNVRKAGQKGYVDGGGGGEGRKKPIRALSNGVALSRKKIPPLCLLFALPPDERSARRNYFLVTLLKSLCFLRARSFYFSLFFSHGTGDTRPEIMRAWASGKEQSLGKGIRKVKTR